MAAPIFNPVSEKQHTRDGRQYLKDTEFCDGVKGALKTTFDNKTYLAATVEGKSELRKLRGALRHFAEEAKWGLSIRTDGDEKNEKGSFTVTFRAQAKRDMPKNAAPRKVRRRKDETDAQYNKRLREKFPKNADEKPADYAKRIAAVTSTAPAAPVAAA